MTRKTLKKKSKEGRVAHLDIKTIYKAFIIKTVWYWYIK